MTPMTDWTRVERKAGPNTEFPGYNVYCWGSRALDERDWVRSFRVEAEEHDAELAVENGVLYVLFPDGSEGIEQTEARSRVRAKRAERKLLKAIRIGSNAAVKRCMAEYLLSVQPLEDSP